MVDKQTLEALLKEKQDCEQFFNFLEKGDEKIFQVAKDKITEYNALPIKSFLKPYKKTKSFHDWTLEKIKEQKFRESDPSWEIYYHLTEIKQRNKKHKLGYKDGRIIFKGDKEIEKKWTEAWSRGIDQLIDSKRQLELRRAAVTESIINIPPSVTVTTGSTELGYDSASENGSGINSSPQPKTRDQATSTDFVYNESSYLVSPSTSDENLPKSKKSRISRFVKQVRSALSLKKNIDVSHNSMGISGYPTPPPTPIAWKNISPNFTEEIIQQWEGEGFTPSEAKEWIDAGFNLEDIDFVIWLKVKLEKEQKEGKLTYQEEIFSDSGENIAEGSETIWRGNIPEYLLNYGDLEQLKQQEYQRYLESQSTESEKQENCRFDKIQKELTAFHNENILLKQQLARKEGILQTQKGEISRLGLRLKIDHDTNLKLSSKLEEESRKSKNFQTRRVHRQDSEDINGTLVNDDEDDIVIFQGTEKAKIVEKLRNSREKIEENLSELADSSDKKGLLIKLEVLEEDWKNYRDKFSTTLWELNVERIEHSATKDDLYQTKKTLKEVFERDLDKIANLKKNSKTTQNQLQQIINELEYQLKITQSNLNFVSTGLANSNRLNNELTIQKAQLQNELNEIEISLQEVHDILSLKNQKISAYWNKIKELEDEKWDLNQTILDKDNEIAQIRTDALTEIQKLTNDYNQLQTNKDQQITNTKNLLKTEQQNHQTTTQALQTEQTTRTTEKTNSDKEIANLKLALTEKETEYQTLSQTNTNLQTEVASLTSQKRNLEIKLTNQQPTSCQENCCLGDYDKVKNELVTKEKEIVEKMNSSLNLSIPQNSDLDKAISIIKELIAKPPTITTDNNFEEQILLKNLFEIKEADLQWLKGILSQQLFTVAEEKYSNQEITNYQQLAEVRNGLVQEQLFHSQGKLQTVSQQNNSLAKQKNILWLLLAVGLLGIAITAGKLRKSRILNKKYAQDNQGIKEELEAMRKEMRIFMATLLNNRDREN